ncbi:monocarboxylate transporter 13-like isoform X2 [Podarcis raffonei]|uniref:monocarboxylate transporter 13-like isoform X2 n=1 Tax=Podarcis raffonei TaxID=65483 RepID=UPI0023296110|nr:monocarboxylate transporter 13-like isoform X2 [Podarcis raffonei]
MLGPVVVHPEAPDGGWGWIIVLSAFLQSALVFGVIRSFGVFFVEFVTYFDELSGRISWITSIGIAVQQFASFGWALVFTPSLASVARYFKRRRTLATSLALTGVGLSSFAFSPLFQLLVDTYAWRGALLIVAGMSFNLVVCGALIRPITLKEDLPGPAGRGARGTCWARFSSLFGLHLLGHFAFMRFVLAVTLVNTGYFVPYVHLVARARELGFDEYQAAFLMSLAAAADLCGRLFSGWLANCRGCRLARILVAWTFLTGVALVAVPWGRDYPLLVAISLCYGFCSGALTPVVFSIIPEIVGIANIFSSMGLLQMIESIGGLLGAPLSGWLRDATGDYVASFLAAGSFMFAGSLVLMTLPNFSSCLAPPSVPEPSAKMEAGEGTLLASATAPVGVLSPHDCHPYKVMPETEEPLTKS